MSELIEIKYNRIKVAIFLLGSLMFVLLGVFSFISPESMSSPKDSVTLIYVIGIICTIFFGGIFLLLIKKVLSKKAGLIISPEGITDNSNASSVGFIPWKDVKKIHVRNHIGNTFLSVEVKNPKDYIQNSSNFVKKYSLNFNMKQYRTPVVISTSVLDCNTEGLEYVLTESFKRHTGNSTPNT